MAMGWSGSNGGIGEKYRKLVVEDIKSEISKYETWSKIVEEKYKPIFQETVSELKGLLKKLKEK